MDDPVVPGSPRPLIVRSFVMFGRFWWEFLIGDTPELFAGAVVIVGLVAWVCVGPAARTWAALVLPVLVIGLLASSVWKAKRKG